MDRIQERVIEYLKQIEMPEPKTKKQLENHLVRIKDRDQIIKLIEIMDFIKNPDSYEIKACFSPCYTFCDRYSFFYDDIILNQYNDFQLTSVVLCEIFNAYQDYFGSGKLINREFVLSSTMLMMYHIGFGSIKLPYSQSKRISIFDEYGNLYINQGIILFYPNKYAAKHLNKKVTNIDYSFAKLGEVRKIDYGPDDLIEIDYAIYRVFVTQFKGFGNLFGNLKHLYAKNEYKCYLKEINNNEYEKLSAHSKEVRDFTSSKRLLEQLSM